MIVLLHCVYLAHLAPSKLGSQLTSTSGGGIKFIDSRFDMSATFSEVIQLLLLLLLSVALLCTHGPFCALFPVPCVVTFGVGSRAFTSPLGLTIYCVCRRCTCRKAACWSFQTASLFVLWGPNSTTSLVVCTVSTAGVAPIPSHRRTLVHSPCSPWGHPRLFFFVSAFAAAHVCNLLCGPVCVGVYCLKLPLHPPCAYPCSFDSYLTWSHLCNMLVSELQFQCIPCTANTYSLGRGHSDGQPLNASKFQCNTCASPCLCLTASASACPLSRGCCACVAFCGSFYDAVAGPYGGNCASVRGDVVADVGFWGATDPETVASGLPTASFVQCPSLYCCRKAPCGAIDACAENREGRLCGRCKPGCVVPVYHDDPQLLHLGFGPHRMHVYWVDGHGSLFAIPCCGPLAVALLLWPSCCGPLACTAGPGLHCPLVPPCVWRRRSATTRAPL